MPLDSTKPFSIANPNRRENLNEYYRDRKSKYRTKELEKRWKLKNQYNLDYADYLRLLEAQSGVCAICGKTPEENGRALSVDHDHACCPQKMKSCGNCIRGLLCLTCNTHLGWYDNNEEKVQEYLLMSGA